MKSFIIILSYVIIITAMLVGCKKTEPTKELESPILPPESSFVMDFSCFYSCSDTSTISIETPASYNNVLHSLYDVNCWNDLLLFYLEIPNISFKEAKNHKPIYNSNTNKWLRTYTVKSGSSTYYCELYCTKSVDNAIWEMFISKNSGFQNFKWYDGISNLDGTKCSWTIYKSSADNSPLIDIDWDNKIKDEIQSIKYTLLDDYKSGDYIKFYKSYRVDYDRSFELYNQDETEKTNIQWNKTTNSGVIYDYDFFNDNDAHCWNSELKDCGCN